MIEAKIKRKKPVKRVKKRNYVLCQEVIEQEFHAAISAEKPTPSTISHHAPPSAPLPSAAHGGITSSEGKRTDAELGEKMPVAVSTQKIGQINDVEILETSFGVSVFAFMSAACVCVFLCRVAL